jgi:hypothetical protein
MARYPAAKAVSSCEGLVAHLASAKPPPCETENCPFYDFCGNYRMACRAFEQYTAKGYYDPADVGNPTANFYTRLLRSK